MTTPAERENLIACYKSGQIDEATWQQHLADDPTLAVMTPSTVATSELLPDEKLGEILAGLDGVTPGPWKFEGSIYEHMGAGIRSIPDDRGFAQLWKSSNVALDAKHIARLDPDTVHALVTELQAHRLSALAPQPMSAETIAAAEAEADELYEALRPGFEAQFPAPQPSEVVGEDWRKTDALEPFLTVARHVVGHPAQYQGTLMRSGGLSNARDLFARDFQRLLAAFTQPSSAITHSESEGDWVLVPREPTRAMLNNIPIEDWPGSAAKATAIYRALTSTRSAPLPKGDVSDKDVIEALVAAVQLVRACVNDAAPHGFNPLEGDWAERLYSSQHDTFEALKLAGIDPRAASHQGGKL